MARISSFSTTSKSDGSVAALRAALRAGAGDSRTAAGMLRAINAAARPLMDRHYDLLLRFCESLVRQSPLLPSRVEGSDIAQDAWLKMLRYLGGESGDRVHSEEHFHALLRSAAHTRFLDLLDARKAHGGMGNALELDAPEWAGTDSAGVTRQDRIVSPGVVPDILRFANDNRAADLVEQLFCDEAAFRRASRQPIRRRLNHYRALVLYDLGLYLHAEAFDRDDAATSGDVTTRVYLRRLIHAVGVPSVLWNAVDSALFAEQIPAPGDVESILIAVVNRVCGAGIKTGNLLSVLRYELRSVLTGQKTERETGDK